MHYTTTQMVPLYHRCDLIYLLYLDIYVEQWRAETILIDTGGWGGLPWNGVSVSRKIFPTILQYCPEINISICLSQ